MTKYVEWNDPYNNSPNPVNLICRVTVEDAIRISRAIHEYQGDEEALSCFITIHWATIKEYPEENLGEEAKN